MAGLMRGKRKGFDSSDFDEEHRASTSAVEPQLERGSSSGGLSRRVKQCKEKKAGSDESCKRSRLHGVKTVPTYAGFHSGCGRGHKRKIGCIDVVTSTGRKKKLQRSYVLERDIGKGKFGSVRVCRRKANGVEFACKTLKKNTGECVHKEVEIMQHLSGHPGIVTLEAVFEDKESIHLVMELCSKGRLLDDMLKGRYSEMQAAHVLKELMTIIKYCHDMGVVHRDIKPENILLSPSGVLKLADFGLAARISDGQTLSGLVGSPAYVAPEVLVGSYSKKVDIWSAGVLLHAFLVARLPFSGKSMDVVFEEIKTVKLDFQSENWKTFSGSLRDLLSKMLTKDPAERITADEVLRHPWILFHTDCLLQTRTAKSFKVEASEPYSEQDSFCCASTESSSEEHREEDSGLVDALAAAISRIGISEPKPILCGAVNPNINLCTAF